MRITINDQFAIEGGEHQWTVYETRSTNGHRLAKAETTTRPVSYHGRLDHALAWLRDRQVRTADGSVTLGEAVGILEQLNDVLCGVEGSIS